MRKRLFLLLLMTIIFTATSMAQVPEGINYQAIARNSSGNVIANQLIGLRFTLRTPDPTGVALYQETDTVTTNQFGLFTIVIGSGMVDSGSLSTISWGLVKTFLEVELDSTGGTNYVVMGTWPWQSVPYAFNAASSAQWLTSGNDIYNLNTQTTHVNGTSAGSTMRIDNSGIHDIIQFHNLGDSVQRGYIGIYSDTAGLDIGTTNLTGTLNLITHNAPRVTIDSIGSVGIGTTTPAYTLDVAGQFHTASSVNGFIYPGINAIIENTNTQGTYCAVEMLNSTDTATGVILVATNTNELLALSVGVATYANVEVGQINSSYSNPATGYAANNIVVNSITGEAAITLGNASGTSGVQIIGATTNELSVLTLKGAFAEVNASTYNNLSDITMKKDVQYLQHDDFIACLDQIRNIQSIRYRYNYESETAEAGMQYRPNLHLGLVAQSLPVEVSTSIVNPVTHETKMGYSLGDMSGLLLAGVKALDNKQTESDLKQAALIKQIDDQQKEIEQLKRMVEKLGNMLGNK